MKKKEEEDKGPVGHVWEGNLEATIWAHPVRNDFSYNVTFSRNCHGPGKDGPMEWKMSTSFNAQELPQLAKLAKETHARIKLVKRLDKLPIQIGYCVR
ncbi:MAG: hypothetical protein AAF585_28035 [Verrucomicrobiota bacterium]